MNIPADRPDDETGATPPSDEVRAGEYVLGVLDVGERARVRARIDAEPAFARLVQRWEDDFSAWLARIDAVAPGAHVWPRIRTRLGWAAAMPARPGLWNDVRVWRGVAGLAAAAGVAALVFGLRAPAPVPAPVPPPVVVAPPAEEQAARPVTVLARDDGSTGWIATLDAAGDKVRMVPVPSPADPAGRVNELWIIPSGGAPISLGYLSNEKAHTIAIPAAARRAVAVGSTFAVTLEPEAGLPHAAPSGPVVAKGGIAQI